MQANSHAPTEINLKKLNYTFTKKPLLVGGKAMEYYGLRKAGNDIDLIAPETDVIQLIKLHPSRVKYLWGDLGVCPFEFEIWRTINLFSYSDLTEDSTENGDFLIISLEKLLLMKALAMRKEKYLKDTQLIVEEIIKQKYLKYDEEKLFISKLLKVIENISFIEKAGPIE